MDAFWGATGFRPRPKLSDVSSKSPSSTRFRKRLRLSSRRIGPKEAQANASIPPWCSGAITAVRDFRRKFIAGPYVLSAATVFSSAYNKPRKAVGPEHPEPGSHVSPEGKKQNEFFVASSSNVASRYATMAAVTEGLKTWISGPSAISFSRKMRKSSVRESQP